MKSRLEQLLDELLRQIDIPAMEQAMSKQYKSQIRRRWELPADYWMLLERCCGLRTVWSNDTYEALELWGLDTLMKGQEGYAYNPVEQKVIKDWDEHLVVIASDAGDPYCLDLRRNDTAVFWAEHGAGTWDFQPAFDCLEDFLESVLDVPKTQEYETAYALEYFGSEQYYSDKFQDEAYLFIPFDENYYQAMAKVMEKRFANWQGQSFDEATLEPSDLAEAMMEYLDCECTYFPSMTDDDPIMSAYNYAKRESVKEGFVPVLIKADDEILWECLIMNSDPDSDGEDDFAFDPDKVAEYRKKMLSAPVENSKAVLEEMIGQRKEEAEDDDMDWDEEILGEMEGGYDNRRFSSYWNSDNNMTYPLILAKIPVKNPWEIFAYLPFGGWNECPNTPELMAVAKYWFEQHGAVPAAMSHDELEFLLPAPVSEEKAMDAAVELYGFCPDVIDQGPEDATVGALADVLRQSTVWYFWWD